MSSLQAFFAQNAAIEVVEEVIVSDRFRDEAGDPIPWKIRSITEEENAELRKAATKKVKGKNGAHSFDFNSEEYLAKMTVAGVVFPNLKDVELQKSYGAMGAESLLRKMLRPGEFSDLLQKVQEINGFNKNINELVEEVKN
ncbi:MAG: phage portal protein [Paenibacillus dendritiformis]|uniref:phage tail assembly chaperone n=1 Tax=uncultured Paenibacillus sp. TaxID=227322 RepID=UPI0025E736B7|nr:phage portal protein [uncultured Paenibacillus sp.]MDU5141062.1 phage portal protein [Paenibacillus dendritiformis]